MKFKGTIGTSTFVIALLMASCQQQSVTPSSPVSGLPPSPTDARNTTPSPASVPESTDEKNTTPSIESISKSVSKQQAAQIFFEAYKAGDRESALEVATDEVVNSLRWDSSAGTNPTLQLSGEDFIYYEGGGINLSFEGDEQQGYKIVEAQAIAD